jgi:uncharacterized protein YjbI with pentapeptide repeats
MSEQHRYTSVLSRLFFAVFGHHMKMVSSSTSRRLSPLPYPKTNDHDAWRSYWIAQGYSWRTEPEITPDRQAYLVDRLAITPNVQRGIYPFKGVELTRADVEWLLVHHEKEYGSKIYMIGKQSSGLDLRGAILRGVNLSRLPLTETRGGLESTAWSVSTQEQREAAAIHLENANLARSDLMWSSLRCAHFEGADLRYTHLEGANLSYAHFAGNDATIPPADLRNAYFSQATFLNGAILWDTQGRATRLADVHWGDVNLSVVQWTNVNMLGDEYEARQKLPNRQAKANSIQIEEYREAVRANRQFGSILQAQELNEDSVRFTYQAQILQRHIFGLQIRRPNISLRPRIQPLAAWLFSWFLYLLAGYGYKPVRSFLAYIFVIVGFAASYYLLGLYDVGPHHLAWYEAIVVSMTAFHGRGFFADQFHPGDPQAFVAAFEAFVGLIIEITLIATLTRRLFGQ